MQTLSLITATYNRAHTIRDTIRSINMQTYPNIDHIIIDGASKDDTMEIVAREAERVSYKVSEKDKGFYHAYNKGLDQAKGEIIGFLNSDDFYCSDDVVAQVMDVFDDPSVDAVHADLVYVDQNDTSKIVRHWRSRPCTEKSLARGFIPAHPTVFLRREVYDKVGQFNLNYKLAADYEFLLRVFHTARVKSVYVPRIWVRMRTGGATGGAMSSIKLQNDEIRRAQNEQNLHYPTSKFYVHKVIDRVLQHARAPLVKMPPEVTAA